MKPTILKCKWLKPAQEAIKQRFVLRAEVWNCIRSDKISLLKSFPLSFVPFL